MATTYRGIEVDGSDMSAMARAAMPFDAGDAGSGDIRPALLAFIKRMGRIGDGYERSILRLLKQLDGSTTGQALLHEIQRRTSGERRMKIRPWFGEFFDPLDPESAEHWSLPAQAGARGIRSVEKLTWRRRRERQPRAVEILFTPALFSRESHEIDQVLGIGDYRTNRELSLDYYARRRPWLSRARLEKRIFGGPSMPGSEMDEVLLHEMVHGVRKLSGHSNSWSEKHKLRFGNYDDIEEVFAILVANIYRSEIGRKGLRKDHHGFVKIETTDRRFLANAANRARLARLRREQPEFFDALQDVEADFNPTRRMRSAA